MLIIEASNIYFRGGFVLLEQMLEYCEENSFKAQVFIGYHDVYECLHKKKYKYISLKKTNEISTLIRYLRKRENILFFCNLPPLVRCKYSILYAHNILFFQTAVPVKGASLLFNLKKFLYYYWLKYFARNVDVVACQTEAVKNDLLNNLGVKSELYPFYRTVGPMKIAQEYEFCYIGSGVTHKNNNRLLDAVDRLSRKYQFRIVLTIEKNGSYRDLIGKIDAINTKYARTIVVNKGMVPYNEVAEIYSASKALIFPSLAETIALPLIEGLLYGLTVLSSDLPFTFQVVENPIVFNPESVDEIAGVMENQLNGRYGGVIQKNKITNKLPELIQYLCP